MGQGAVLGGIGLPLILVKVSQPRLCTDPEPVWCRYQLRHPIVGQGVILGGIGLPLILVKALAPSVPTQSPSGVTSACTLSWGKALFLVV